MRHYFLQRAKRDGRASPKREITIPSIWITKRIQDRERARPCGVMAHMHACTHARSGIALVSLAFYARRAVSP